MAHVFVLGHHGMLGHMVCRYLRTRGHEVRTSSVRHSVIDPTLVRERVLGCEVVVNCIGRIPQRGKDDFLEANVDLPRALVTETELEGQLLIHASTDAVFSGSDGPYAVFSEHDALDEYGQSKSLAEQIFLGCPRATIIRTSIIGPGSEHGLLGWLLSKHSGERVAGYVNHIWNGITTLEWAKLCDRIITHRVARPAVLQVGTWPPLSKAQFLRIAAAVYDLEVSIHDVEHSRRVDRSLFPMIRLPSIVDQLSEMREFYSPGTPAV